MHQHSPTPVRAARRGRVLAALAAGAVAAASLVALAAPAQATDATSMVSPLTPGWSSADTRPGGTYRWSDEFGAPDGFGESALRLETTTGAAKVQYFTGQDAGLRLADISSVSYSSYRSSASTGIQLQIPAVNVYLDPDGPAGPLTFAPMIFEPYYTYGPGTNDEWLTWDGATPEAKWWSTRQVGSICAFDCYVTLDTFKQQAPDATVTAYGFNQGSGNPGIIAAVDGLTINDKTFDFEDLAGIVVDDDGKGAPGDCDADDAAFGTIQAAVTYATAGDTVEVCAGSYTENITVNKQLTFRGAQAGVDARTGRTDLTAESVVHGWLNANGVSGTVIDGFYFTDNTTSTSSIAMVGGSGHQVTNTVVADNMGPNVQHAIVYTATGDAPTTFTRNRVEDVLLHGIFGTGDTRDVTVADNAFVRAGSQSAVHFAPPIGGGSDVVVEGNTSSGGGSFIAGTDVDGMVVRDNVVEDAVGSGIALLGGFKNVLVEDNVIRDGSSNGISVSFAFGGGPNSGLTITSNEIVGNLRGISFNAGGSTGTPQVHFNRLVDSTSGLGIRNLDSVGVNAENNWWGCNEGAGTADCDADQGVIDVTPRLVLQTEVGTDPVSATAMVTADLTHNSNGVDVSGIGTLPPTAVTFAASAGELSSTSATLVDGRASVTLSRAGAEGAGSVSSTVDAETAAAGVTFVAPEVSVSDVTLAESVGTGEVTVSLDLPNDEDVSFSYATADGTAGGDDYVGTSGTAVIPAGSTSTTVEVEVLDDAFDELDETLTVNISGASLVIADAQATVTIADDEAAPVVSVSDSVEVKEGKQAKFTVTVVGATALETSVDVTTTNGTAKAPGDFKAVTRTIVFEPGETSAVVKVKTKKDGLREDQESFNLLLSGAEHLTIGDGAGVGLIKQNKSLPRGLEGTDL